MVVSLGGGLTAVLWSHEWSHGGMWSMRTSGYCAVLRRSCRSVLRRGVLLRAVCGGACRSVLWRGVSLRAVFGGACRSVLRGCDSKWVWQYGVVFREMCIKRMFVFGSSNLSYYNQ